MKGMQAISRGSGFGGTVKYGLINANGDLEGKIIGGNMSGTTAKELTAEFGLSRKLRPDIKNPVWHNSLRSPEEEKLTDEQFVRLLDDYMKRMGFTDAHPRVYILHDDEKGRHAHIVASRIGVDGSIYYGKNENLKSTRIINRLEKVHGLVQTKGPIVKGEKVVSDVKRPTFGEVGKYKRTGETPDREALAKLIDQAIADKPSASVFAERLVLAGIEVRANFGKGELNGFSFKINDVPFKGSQIGPAYTGQALIKRGLTYEHHRDYAQLKAIGAAPASAVEHDRVATDPGAVEPNSRNPGVDRAGEGADRRIDADGSGADRGFDAEGAGADRGFDAEGAGGDRAIDQSHPANSSDLWGDDGQGASADVRVPGTADDQRPGRGNSTEHSEIGLDTSDRESDHSADRGREGPEEDSGTKTSGAGSPSYGGDRSSVLDSASDVSGGGISSGVDVSDSGFITTGDKWLDQLLRASHQDRLKSERERIAADKKSWEAYGANQRKLLAEMNRPHGARLARSASISQNVEAYRLAEIQRFALAMGGGKFQVTCTPANAKAKPIKHTFTAEQMQSPKFIKDLSRLSARNHQISIQPSDSAGLILLKGLDAHDIQKLEAAGLAPAASVTFAGKTQAWIATGEKLTTEERRALTSRIESLVGLEKKAGMAGRLVGFAGATLTDCRGQIAPAAAELIVEVRGELVEAKKLEDQKLVEAKSLEDQQRRESIATQRLENAIKKEVVVHAYHYVDQGGIKSLEKGWFYSRCHAVEADATLLGGKYAPEVVENAVLESMARQGVNPSQAYRAVFDGSRVKKGDELHAAKAVAEAYTRVALLKEGKDLAGIDVAAEAAKRYPKLLKRAETKHDSYVEATHGQVKKDGAAQSKEIASNKTKQKAIKAKKFAAQKKAALNADGTIKPDD